MLTTILVHILFPQCKRRDLGVCESGDRGQRSLFFWWGGFLDAEHWNEPFLVIFYKHRPYPGEFGSTKEDGVRWFVQPQFLYLYVSKIFFKAPKSTNRCFIPLCLKNGIYCARVEDESCHNDRFQSPIVFVIFVPVFVFNIRNKSRNRVPKYMWTVLEPSPVLHSKFYIKVGIKNPYGT